MRTLRLLLVLVGIIAWGCSDGAAQDPGGAAPVTQAARAAAPVTQAAGAGAPATQAAGAGPAAAQAAPTGTWQKLVMHPFDGSGTVLVEMPLPSTWQVNSRHAQGEPTIVGPNGIKIIDIPGQNFVYPHDPWMRQSYAQSGQPLRAMPSIEQLIQQDFVPWAASQGLTFVRQYEVPEVTRIDQWYNDQLYKPVPGPTVVKAIGTEWKHSAGHPYFILVHLVVGTTDALQLWYYYSTGLQAAAEHFEAARKQLLFGLANAHYHPEPILAFNRMEAEKAGQSWAAHNQRMAENQARFEASQRDFVNRSNAAHDALMAGWQSRNAASDVAHERFVDTITERTKVVDPTTGKTYKVQSGSNQYWMNSNGEYIGTNDPDYDPNKDELLDQGGWQQLEDGG